MDALQAVHVTTGRGSALLGPGDRCTLLVTGEESGGAIDCLVGRRWGPPLHRHLAEDEP